MTHEQARTFVKEHLQDKGNRTVEVTEHLVHYWWRLLNVAVFYGRLHKPFNVEIKRCRRDWAWIEPTNSGKGYVKLRVEPVYLSRLLFLTILVHEMVHVWENQHHTVMGHGKRFFAWKNRIKRTVGLDLSETVSRSEYERKREQ